MNRMIGWSLAAIAATAIGTAMAQRPGGAVGTAAPPRVAAASPEAAGRYLVLIGGCNDCHTPGYAQSNGAEPPERDWLKGSDVGFRGPWGVTYAANLRLSVSSADEAGWVAAMRQRGGMPPMPWPSLNHMAEEDLRAIYRYIRALGEPGAPAPATLPPGTAPATPVMDFVPVMPASAPPR